MGPMACGVPALVTAPGAQAHTVGLNGMVLPPGDAPEWARAMVAVATDVGLRGRMAAAGLRRMAELRATVPLMNPLVQAPAGRAWGGESSPVRRDRRPPAAVALW